MTIKVFCAQILDKGTKITSIYERDFPDEFENYFNLDAISCIAMPKSKDEIIQSNSQEENCLMIVSRHRELVETYMSGMKDGFFMDRNWDDNFKELLPEVLQ